MDVPDLDSPQTKMVATILARSDAFCFVANLSDSAVRDHRVALAAAKGGNMCTDVQEIIFTILVWAKLD